VGIPRPDGADICAYSSRASSTIVAAMFICGDVSMAHTILRLPAVKQRSGLSRSSIYLAMARGEFPRAIRLGQHAVGWLEADVERWIAERVERSRACGAPGSAPQAAI
jgi:prophage regulatory protein